MKQLEQEFTVRFYEDRDIWYAERASSRDQRENIVGTGKDPLAACADLMRTWEKEDYQQDVDTHS